MHQNIKLSAGNTEGGGGLKSPQVGRHSICGEPVITAHRYGVVCDSINELCVMTKVYSNGSYRNARQNDLVSDHLEGGGNPLAAAFLLAASKMKSDGFTKKICEAITKNKGNYSGSWDYDGPGPFFKGNLDTKAVGGKFVFSARQVRAADPNEPLAAHSGKMQAVTSIKAAFPLTPISEGLMVVDLARFLKDQDVQSILDAGKQRISPRDTKPKGVEVEDKRGNKYVLGVKLSQPSFDHDRFGETTIETKGSFLIVNYDPGAKRRTNDRGNYYEEGSEPPFAIPYLRISVKPYSAERHNEPPLVTPEHIALMRGVLAEFCNKISEAHGS